MQNAPSIVFNDANYRIVYAKKKVLAAMSGGVESSVSIEATHRNDNKQLWRKTLESLYGEYKHRDFKTLGFFVDRLSIEKTTGGQPYLLIHTNRPAYFALDPFTGENFISRYRTEIDKVPVAEKVKFSLDEIRFTEIQAMPGYGVVLKIGNTGASSFAIERFYVPFQAEAFDSRKKSWAPIAESDRAYDHLQLVKAGGEFEIFIPADVFEKMLRLNYAVFAPYINNNEGNALFRAPSMTRFSENNMSHEHYTEYRVGIAFYAMDDQNESFPGISKNYIILSIEEIIRLLSSRE